jgi:ribonuclease E
MSNIDSPTGSTGGPVTVPAQHDLPEKMRVHALAKLLVRTSREVLAALADLGVEVRSAQSSIDRKVAEQVAAALASDAVEPAGAAVPEAAAPAPVVPEPVAATEEPNSAFAPVFAPPTPLFQAPTRPTRTRRRAAEPEVVEPAVEPEPEAPAPRAGRRRAKAKAEQADEQATVDQAAVEPAVDDRAADTGTADTGTADTGTADTGTADTRTADTGPAADDSDDDSDDDSAARRRRRRGRRGRGRGRGGEGLDDENGEDTEETNGSDEESDSDESDDSDEETGQSDGESSGSRRRRRRRRRKGSGEDSSDSTDEADPPNTVVRVRQPREQRSDDEGDGVQSVRGSTRLEAKRQRRRDGRDAGRRRVPILSEAEFLARREAVDRTMVVRERGDRIEIAVLEDEVLVEHFVTDRQGGTGPSMVGNIYLGRVQNVLPSMEAAFVDIGRGRNAVLYAGEVDWDAAGLGGKARRIEQALSSGDSVLVQVTKDPIGHKGARLTTQISLAGRFLVYVPSGGAAGISRKLPDVERKRLKDMLKEIVPSEAGVIIRTASEGVSHEALERDVRRLQVQWDVVKGKAEQTGPNKPKAPVLLYEEPDLLIKVVRDQFNEDFSRLVVEGDDAWDTLQNYVGHVAPELAGRLERHVGRADVFAEHRIDEQLLKALDRKVWLPSGGTLVIDRTEAMTVIDVNTGKYTGSGGNLEETVTRNNLEAAEEVVRQLRLRDIGGIIVVDFIDMVLEANRDLVLRRLTECLSRDRTRHQVAEVTSLGLVQMTRKRVGGGLLEHFSTPCEACRGRGIVVNTEPLTEKAEPGRGGERAERSERPEREGSGRRSRGRGRRGDGDQDQDSGAQDGGEQKAADRADAASAAVQVGAPAPAVAAPAAAVVEAPVVEVADMPAEDAPVVDAPAVEAHAVEVPVTVEQVAPESVTVGTGADPVADAVEEVVVERSVAERVEGSGADTAVPATPAPAAADGSRNGQPRPPRQRRGRVTRTAGAPTATTGDAPAGAVVTLPSSGNEQAAPVAAAPVAVAPQPEPTVATRPRRTRRAASRPAGPPVADGVADAGGDPV